MSGDGGGDSDSDGEKGGGFGSFASSVGDALTELSDAAGQAARDAASREEAAASMSSVGVSNMSGMDTFSPETGKSTSTAATASSSNRGTSGNTSGFGIDAIGRDSTGAGTSSGATSTGFGIDLGAALNPEPIANQGNLMEAFNPVAASNMPGMTSPARTAARTDTMTYTAPSNARSVDTQTAYASPTGYNAQATERAGRFSTNALSPGQRAYDLSTRQGIIEMAYAKFRDAGYTHEQAAGVLGNMKAESNFDPGVIGALERSYGMYQHYDRAPALMEFAGKRGVEWSDPEAQVDFALHELETTEARAARSLAAAQTPREAALAFSKDFERPNAALAHNDRRVEAAEQFAEQFADWEPATNPNTFSGNLNVAMAPTGVELDDIDLPGSRSFASNQTSQAVGTPDAKPGSTTAVASFDNAVGPLADRAFAGPMPTTTDELAAAIGAPTQTAANTSMGRLESTYLDPDVRSVTTQTISVNPSTQQASTVASTAPDVVSAPTTAAMGYQPTTTATAPTPENVQTKTGLNNTAKTVISTGVDAAVGAVPGIGLVNTAAAGVNLVGDLVGADINVPTVGSLVANALDRSAQGDWDGTAPDISETDPTEVAEAEAETADDTSQEAATADIDNDPVVRLETRYLSPYPTPAERWGPNARQYRGA